MPAPRKPEGRLAILLPGLGAVATTLIAGVDLARRGKAKPIGSLTQLGTARLGRRTDNRVVPISELVPLASLDQVVFGAWDAVSEDGLQVARRSRVLAPPELEAAREALQAIKPRTAVFDAVRRRYRRTLCVTRNRSVVSAISPSHILPTRRARLPAVAASAWSAISEKHAANSVSPASTAVRGPRFVCSVGTPRRRAAPSMRSSCTSVAMCISSIAAASRAMRPLSALPNLAASMTKAGRSILPFDSTRRRIEACTSSSPSAAAARIRLRIPSSSAATPGYAPQNGFISGRSARPRTDTCGARTACGSTAAAATA